VSDKTVKPLMDGVRQVIARSVGVIAGQLGDVPGLESVMPGKMLRTRLAARLNARLNPGDDIDDLIRICAATEMIHTASLCHDDVIDQATTRRAEPALWCVTTPSCAILIGDLLLCEAMATIGHVRDGHFANSLLAKIREVCMTEAEQELALRNKQLDTETCLRVARGKTGPLFAFVAQVCGGDDEELSAALEEAGYRIGTAYQLGDDVLDMSGLDDVLGKTLGTDAQRGKLTLPQDAKRGAREACARIRALLESALDCLAPWPAAQAGLREYLRHDLKPAVQGRITLWKSDMDLGLAV